MEREDTQELPTVIPVFPLPGVLLLPSVQLPLNIFEPRYLAMFNDALASNRYIGMIQPSEVEDVQIIERDVLAQPERCLQCGVEAVAPRWCNVAVWNGPCSALRKPAVSKAA